MKYPRRSLILIPNRSQADDDAGHPYGLSRGSGNANWQKAGALSSAAKRRARGNARRPSRTAAETPTVSGRPWGVSVPGQRYPQIEGPGNPSWEARNPEKNPNAGNNEREDVKTPEAKAELAGQSSRFADFITADLQHHGERLWKEQHPNENFGGDLSHQEADQLAGIPKELIGDATEPMEDYIARLEQAYLSNPEKWDEWLRTHRDALDASSDHTGYADREDYQANRAPSEIFFFNRYQRYPATVAEAMEADRLAHPRK